MQTTLTLEKLYDAYQSLDRLGQREGMKAAPSWWIASTLKKWKPDCDAFAERRQKLIEKYGERRPAGDEASGRELWTIRLGQETEFENELRPLLDMPVEVSATPHSLTWLGGGIAGAIEPDILYHLGFILLEVPPAMAEARKETLTRANASAFFAAVSAASTYRMPESLAWWFADLLGQAYAISRDTGRRRQQLLDALCVIADGKRTPTPEYRQANATLDAEIVEVAYIPRPFTDLGELVEKWPPTMISPMLFAFTEPQDDPATPGLPQPTRP